mmetsp:Transcript_24014/g.51373  ORF Transcript_24014/g.51373 Transcript_24014/m.51373 type:complete len:145 (-) Transcript_24014:535-969(-)
MTESLTLATVQMPTWMDGTPRHSHAPRAGDGDVPIGLVRDSEACTRLSPPPHGTAASYFGTTGPYEQDQIRFVANSPRRQKVFARELLHAIQENATHQQHELADILAEAKLAHLSSSQVGAIVHRLSDTGCFRHIFCFEHDIFC